MGAGDFLSRLVRALDEAPVPYMLSGSFASSLHGEPRATQDIDLVIDPTLDGLRRLLELLPDDVYYVSHDAALDALRRRSQFNVVDFDTGWKADLIVRKGRPFSVEEFARRRPADVLGTTLYVASPEDVVLAKLEWALRGGGSERQLRDVRGVLSAVGDDLDRSYVARWASALGITSVWEQVARSR